MAWSPFGHGNAAGGWQTPGPPPGMGYAGAPTGQPGRPISGDDIQMLIAQMGQSHLQTQQSMMATQQAVTNMAYSQQQTVNNLANVVQKGAGRGADSSGCRPLKPKKEIAAVTAKGAEDLMSEMIQFEIDLGEIGVSPHSEAGYRQLRAQTEGRAREVLDFEAVQGRGKALKEELDGLIATNGPQTERDFVGANLYRHVLTALERAVRLTPERRLEIAESAYNSAVMREDTAAGAVQFLDDWRRARHMMFREGLINKDSTDMFDVCAAHGLPAEICNDVFNSIQSAERRKMNAFLQKRITRSVHFFIKSQARPPRSLAECIESIELWIEAHQDKSKVEGSRSIHAIMDGSVCDSQPANDQAAYDGDINKIGPGKNAGYLASGGKKGAKGTRDTNAPKGGGKLSSAPPKGVPQCPDCHGYHGDVKVCLKKWRRRIKRSSQGTRRAIGKLLLMV